MIEAMAGLRITTIFTFMSLIITLQTSSAQRFDIKVTETPVIAPEGSDADLGCSLVPAGSAESMTIKFHRGNASSYVYMYEKGKEDLSNQNETYKGRTEFLTGNITQGQVTLKIKNVRPSDTGNYTCLFVSPNHYSTGIVELQLAGSLKAWQIALIAVGCIAAVAALGLLIYKFMKKKADSREYRTGNREEYGKPLDD
ncbi:hypothetical protein XENTR_v10022687 [Xenopus tropicalis]|nr:hypothetical protein XENTR_v10022687 [Xenopus tropicalis]